MQYRSLATLLCSGLSLSILILFTTQACNNKDAASFPKAKADSNYYLGASECGACHIKEFKDWQQSDHFLAMQTASDSSVLGNFENASYTADGVRTQFLKQDEKYLINTQGASGKNEVFEVAYTFGYFPLQQYLVKTQGGRMQASRVSWDSRNKKWFHQYPGQKIHHRDWLHWTGNSQNWNTMCASCHSTNFKKNYNYDSDSYSSTYSEINVACESCHGRGALHKAYVQSESYKKGERILKSKLLLTNNVPSKTQLNTCAPCHARKADISSEPLNSEEILDDLIPELISNEHYYADGQIKDEDYEYGSFAQSKMYHSNIRCSNCHNPHSGKTLKQGNDLCLSCHLPKYAEESHHFHKKGKGGDLCINCHMTERTYMGNDHRRDHSFRIPRPDQSAVYKTPNACNTCHTKQNAQWAANSVKKWYGPTRAYHFSDDLLPGSLLNEQSEAHLKKLAGDTSQPEIARATAVYYLGELATTKACEYLIELLNDKKAFVRYQVLRALENYPPQIWEQAAAVALKDKVRAVRIAAADLYHRIGKDHLPQSLQKAYVAADLENQSYLYYQRDFAVGNVMVADYLFQDKDYRGAVEHYLRGLQKDSLMNYARFNLSAAYNSIGKNQEALSTLKDAARTDPKNERSYYNLGLLYYEMHNLPEAIRQFETACQLSPGNSNLYYNYGLLLEETGNLDKAEKILLKGIKTDPSSSRLNYALAFLYLKNHAENKAKVFTQQLYLIDSENPEYESLFKQFGYK